LDRRKTVFWVLVVTGLGAALRMVALGSVPVGLYQDEAYNGLDALRVLAGERPLYFPANNGREPLFIYLVSASIAWLGRTPLAVRLPAALLGTLTIPISAALGTALFNRRVGLLTAALVAFSFWPLHLSRIGFRAVGLPLFTGLALALAWHGVSRSRRGWVVLGGLAYGLAFYTYLPVYFSPLILGLLAFALWLTGKRAVVRRAVPWFLLGTAVALVPFVVNVAGDPGVILGRAGQVSILSPAPDGGEALATLTRSIGRGLGMFVWRGDTIPRHNLPGRPVFDWLLAPFFLVGTLWAARHWRRPAVLLALLWPAVMLAPTILAEDTPHFLRAVGVMPFVFLPAALGLEVARQGLAARVSRPWLPDVLLGMILLGSLGWTVSDYFGRYATDPRTAFAFQDAATELAAEMNREAGPIWASERFRREWESIPFLVTRDVHWIPDGALPEVAVEAGVLFLWPYEPVAPIVAALPPGVRMTGWRGPLARGDLEVESYPLYWGYRLEPAPLASEPVARFSDGIGLLAATATREAERVEVSLVWTATGPVGADALVFAHLVDEVGLVGQLDGSPAEGTLPTQWWRPGDQVVDRRLIEVPGRGVTGRLQVVVGLYRSDNGERLAVIDSDGRLLGDSVTVVMTEVPGR
jgi:4-amino-4-deoxy-L-arabinose transferase-like glycosyltransferase